MKSNEPVLSRSTIYFGELKPVALLRISLTAFLIPSLVKGIVCEESRFDVANQAKNFPQNSWLRRI
ncbi:MAG: hypothetical protein WBS33_19790 [Verrucomicrobiia bacterium]